MQRFHSQTSEHLQSPCESRHCDQESEEGQMMRSEDSVGMIPTHKELTLPNSPSNSPHNTGQYQKVSATRTPGQKQIHRKENIRELVIGLASNITLCNRFCRTSRSNLDKLLAKDEKICGASTVFVSKRIVIGLPPYFRARYHGAASIEGLLCHVMAGTMGWMRFSNLVTSIFPQ